MENHLEPTWGRKNRNAYCFLSSVCTLTFIQHIFYLSLYGGRETTPERLSRGRACGSPFHFEERLPSVFLFSCSPGSREVV